MVVMIIIWILFLKIGSIGHQTKSRLKHHKNFDRLRALTKHKKSLNMRTEFCFSKKNSNPEETIITLEIDSLGQSQIQHYNNYFLEKCKKYDWTIVCDLDEFIYARNNFKNIKEYLNTLDDKISQVFIPWKMFGSSGFNTIDKKQPESVIKNFIKRTNYDKDCNFQGVIMEGDDKYSLTKCIVRNKYLKKFGIHSHEMTNNNFIGPDNNNSIKNNVFYKINEKILSESFLHLNHYPIQSYEWFMRIKATRGDSVCVKNVRDENYYRSFDNSSNDIEDNELMLLN